MNNEHKQLPRGKVEVSDTEQAARDAARAKSPEQIKAEQVAALKTQAAATIAGYSYQGVRFDLESKLAYYEGVARKASAGLLDGLYPIQLIGLDGIVSAADAAEVAAAYADMEANWMSVQLTLGAQIKAVLNG